MCLPEVSLEVDPDLVLGEFSVPGGDSFLELSGLVQDRISNIDHLAGAERASDHFTKFYEVFDLIKDNDDG